MRLANLPLLPVAGLGLAVSAASALAQSYVGSAYEGFNYTAGANIDSALNGGTGFPSAWNSGVAPAGTAGTTIHTIHSAGLDYANSAYAADLGGETGLAAFITGTGGSSQVPRAIGQTVDSGTFYFSYLTQKTVDTQRTINFSFFGTTATPGTYNERLAIGQIGNNTTLVGPIPGTANSGAFVALVSNTGNAAAGGANGVYSAAGPVSYTLGDTFLVAGKIEFNYADGKDRLSLYINPTNLVSEAALTPYLVVDNNDFGALAMFRMFSGATAGGFNASGGIFDEIRFGDSYLAVTGAVAIPEPGTYAAMAGCLGLAFALLRRRPRG